MCDPDCVARLSFSSRQEWPARDLSLIDCLVYVDRCVCVEFGCVFCVCSVNVVFADRPGSVLVALAWGTSSKFCSL